MSKTQTMKPETAARKLGIYLQATPPEFQAGPVSREQLNELQATPPQWLVELRLNGPHPRATVARKLGISNSGLVRAGVADSMTTAEIKTLLDEMPAWLEAERSTQAAVREDNKRLKELKELKKEK